MANQSDTQTQIDQWKAASVGHGLPWIGNAEWHAVSLPEIPTISPIDGSTLSSLAESGEQGVDAAVAAARAVFTKRTWVDMPRRERKRILLRFADLIAANRFELGVLQCRDMGMPLNLAIHFDVGEAANSIRWYAEAIDKMVDEIVPMSGRETGYITRVPLGVVGAIVPWNFPLMIAAWKLGPALAMGNSVVLKPAEDASLAILKLGKLAAEAGLPEGVFNIVPGTGAVTGEALALHGDVDCLTFTGSGRIGRRMLEYSARSNMKRVSLECGGKTANIVFADAPDIEEAIQVAARSVFRNQGQICNAPTRLLVEKSIYRDLVGRVIEIAKTLRTGNPLDTDSDLGPVVNERQLSAIRVAIDVAEANGIRIALDGRNVSGVQNGFYIGPTIATEVPPSSTLAQEEVFGPVLAVTPFEGTNEALEIANGTRYGLGAQIWTGNIDRASYLSDRLVAGSVSINGGSGLLIEMPLGGFKESGFGRDRSLHALDKYSDLKGVSFRRNAVREAI